MKLLLNWRKIMTTDGAYISIVNIHGHHSSISLTCNYGSFSVVVSFDELKRIVEGLHKRFKEIEIMQGQYEIYEKQKLIERLRK